MLVIVMGVKFSTLSEYQLVQQYIQPELPMINY